MSSFFSKKFVLYTRTASAAFVCAALAAVTSRDMYEKHQWDTVSPGTTSQLRTGDVILISNRWFTLDSHKHKLYSFMCKLLMKTAWDDCGVVVTDPSDDDEPYILIVEYNKINFQKLRDFCAERKPRGVAVRQILAPSEKDAPAVPAKEVIFPFVEDMIANRKVTPFSILRASFQNDRERTQYRWAVECSELAFEIRQKRAEDSATEQALGKMTDQLHDRIGMEAHFAKSLGAPPAKPYPKLYNASLVAEVLQEIGLLRTPHPFAYRYTPVDLAWRVPMINVALSDPKMIYNK